MPTHTPGHACAGSLGALCPLHAAAPEMAEALLTLLNVEGAAAQAAEEWAAADPTREKLDVKYHFDKARAALAKAGIK